MLSSGSTLGVNPMQSGSSYSNERPAAGIEEFSASDGGAFGGFFHADYKKHDDLKQMLDSNKDNLKLEAMKRIIGMIAKGRDASDLFPAVVKNVVSKNIEVKKLVYVYLVRYAEEQQDLALLSISTFQRALKDPNQLIRAGALRVLSSIRVSMIVPIVMLAIRDSASDMSPYVRKTAAHAIPKLFSLDSEQKDELISVIEKLLSDRTTLVVGSAVMAFEEVCPERVDLIHKNYKKLCNLLVDVDEWGQVIIINMLTRYARTQFTDPNIYDIEPEDPNKPFYDATSSDSDSGSKDMANSSKDPSQSNKKSQSFTLDVDHRNLLRQTKPLLQSRNASVVMAVAQLYHHIAPRNEVGIVAKALIRLLRSHKEVQSVVLTCIASMSVNRKSIFEQFMKSFFVRTSDPTHIKLLKLEILTNLATETNISIILREFQTYISSNDKDFVAATIQAIGRCAATITEVTDTCLNGLVHLLSNRDEYVVAESVVVIKKLLQTQSTEHRDIISQMAKLLDFITIPAARASILWLIGEYNDRVPKLAPDVLRKLAKSFSDEEDIVKLQVLNLSVKLFLTNPKQTELLCQYIFNLARFDQNYDIRDRARFLKQFIFPSNSESTILSRNAKNIFLATKPAPTLESKHQGREQFQLGSLSHYMNMRASGYNDLPDYPETAPDSTVRIVEIPTESSTYTEKTVNETKKKKQPKKAATFYSESEKSSSEYSTESGSDSSENDDDDDDDDEERAVEAVEAVDKKKKLVDVKKEADDGVSADSEEDSSDSGEEENGDGESSSEESDSDSSDESSEESPVILAPKKKNEIPGKEAKSNLELLLDLDDIPPMGNVMTPSLGGFLTPLNPGYTAVLADKIELVGPSYIPLNTTELLNKINGYGLAITYRFTRAPHIASTKMISIELIFSNQGNTELKDISIGSKNLPFGMTLNEFQSIGMLAPKSTMYGTLGIDFNDSTQPASFSIRSSGGTSNVIIRSPIGEIMRAVSLSDNIFKIERGKLRGMNEHSSDVKLGTGLNEARCLQQQIYEIANLSSIFSSNENTLNFAGQTMSSKSLVLVSIDIKETNATITVNCEKMVVGSMLLTEIKSHIKEN